MFRFSLKLSVLKLIFITLLFEFTNGQELNFIQKIDAFPVQDENSLPYPFPLLGGFNAPRPQFADIDGDNDPDLFIQENKGQLIFFENIGSNTNYQFKWITNIYNNINIDDWFRFVDMDNDMDFDLLVARPLSLMKYFRNDGSVTSPDFTLLADTLKDINGVPIPAEINSIPVLCDIDGDNNRDLFIGRQSGRVTYFKNNGLDANNLPRFEFVTDSFQNILIIGGAQPNTLHGANSLEFADIDNDMDFDLIWGDFFSPSLYLLENTGTPQVPHLELIYDEYPPSDPLLNGGWNIPRFADIDDDNDFDLFVGEVGGAFSTTSNQIENLYFYENTGSQQNPLFTQRTTQLIPSLDIGKKSIPAFVDIDNDGDLDLFISGEVDPVDPNYSSLNYFKNIGTNNSPEFKLIDHDYLNLNFGYNYSPAFTDIDADGDYDLFIGKFFGQIYFLENTGTPSTPNFPTIVQNFESIDIGSNATPTFVDIDADNDYDLFIGEFNGNINFYENMGDSANPNFVAITDSFFNIDAGDNSFPFFADIDNDTDFDLIVGSQNNGFAIYRNIGSPQIPDFVFDRILNIYTPLYCTPVLADIDNDNDPDLFSGSLGGGLVFYENKDTLTAINNFRKNLPNSFRLYQNYPNPFNPVTTIKYVLSIAGKTELNIYNSVGQRIRTLVNRKQSAGTYEVIWNGTDNKRKPVSSGIYFYQLKTDEFMEAKKAFLLR